MNCLLAILTAAIVFSAATVRAQQGPARPSNDVEFVRQALPDTPVVLYAGGGQYVRVVPIKGLRSPWALANLPNGDILVTEKAGALRIIRNGVLDPKPLAGLPQVGTGAVNSGLMDVMLHPRYAENKFIYFTYSKTKPGGPFPDNQGKRDAVAVTLARARYEGGDSLADVKDLFVADAWSQGTSAGRIAFARDGKIFLAVGMPTRHPIGTADDAQNPANHAGKILRLNDDGTTPSDNPFVGRAGYRPEIYALGIRNAMGLFVHPETGELWETENGPMGGDEINIIRAGQNYGWPVISYGRDYTGNKLGGLSGTTTENPMKEGMEDPVIFWMPSPALAGIIVYTGDKFPAWKGNVFVGAMGLSFNGVSRQLHRITVTKTGAAARNGLSTLLGELKQRIRDVRQGPDGLLYLTTDEATGAVLKVEPVAPDAASK
jgi:glucose/arabinose dehydrogenase